MVREKYHTGVYLNTQCNNGLPVCLQDLEQVIHGLRPDFEAIFLHKIKHKSKTSSMLCHKDTVRESDMNTHGRTHGLIFSDRTGNEWLEY